MRRYVDAADAGAAGPDSGTEASGSEEPTRPLLKKGTELKKTRTWDSDVLSAVTLFPNRLVSFL